MGVHLLKTDYNRKIFVKNMKPHKPDGHIEMACRAGKGYICPLDSLVSQYKYCIRNNVEKSEYVGIKSELKRRLGETLLVELEEIK